MVADVSFELVTSDNEALGVFVYAKRDRRPADIIPQGPASLRVVDVIGADAAGDDSKVGLLEVEPLGYSW